jgi:hypothetical protein
VQVASIKTRVESACGFSALKQKYRKLLLKLAFNVNLRRFTLGGSNGNILLWKRKVRWCMSTLSNLR